MTPAPNAQPATPRRLRRPSRRLLVVLGVLLALVLGFLAGDWFVRRTVQHRVATALAPTLETTPRVQVGGWSAIYGLATDSWPSVRVTADDARTSVQGKELHARLDLAADDVRGLARGNTLRAGRLSGSVDITWHDLEAVTGIKLAPLPDGLVQATTSVDVLGERLPVVVSGQPGISVDAQQVQLLTPKVTLDGVEVPDAVVTGMLPRVESRLKLPEMAGVRVVTLQSLDRGPRIGVDGADLSLPRP